MLYLILQDAPVKHACTICAKSYSRKYLLNKHLREAHGVEDDKCTRNFNCPFKCGVRPYRTNTELLRHCEEVHQTSLGKAMLYRDIPALLISIISRHIIAYMNTCACAYWIVIMNFGAGKKEFKFSTMAEFAAWKNQEEASTRTSYVRTQQTYHPVCEGIMGYYYIQ